MSRHSDLKLRPKQKLVIALEDLDFSWLPSEVALVKAMWDSDYHIADIAAKVKRVQDEVAVLIMHLARKKKIKNRKTGVFGH